MIILTSKYETGKTFYSTRMSCKSDKCERQCLNTNILNQISTFLIFGFSQQKIKKKISKIAYKTEYNLWSCLFNFSPCILFISINYIISIIESHTLQ